ncbi:MAG: hypothetical protein IIB87_08695 [Chloroflexi bacterium]|nr:hypothetical protein [Chloroflexota bacterium]
MTNFMRTLLIGTALLAGALLLACGSDSDSDADGPSDSPDATESADDSSIEPADGNGDQPAGDAFAELRNLAAEFGAREIKIEYQFTSGAAGGIGDGTMTLYWKPPDTQRIDLSMSTGDVTLITTATASYMCTSAAGTGQCLEMPLDDSLAPDFFGIFTDPASFIDEIDATLGDVDIDRSSRTIAGQNAICFSMSGTIGGETGAAEYCFRDDGVLLLLRATGGPETEGGGEFFLEAISVEDSVSDSDLEPPYEVVDLGDLGDLIP